MDKKISTKAGVYRYDLDGLVVFYDRTGGLVLLPNNKFRMEGNYIKLQSIINEIIDYEVKAN